MKQALLFLWMSVGVSLMSGLCHPAEDSASYYLVDSLNIAEFTASDSAILDSTLKLYHGATTDTGRILALNYVCENMMHQDWNKYQRLQYDMILNLMEKDSSLTSWLKKPLADALNNLGYIYYYQEGGREEGLDYFLKSLKLQEEVGDEKGLGTSYSNIGFIYNSQGDVKKALEYYHKGLRIRERLNDKKGMGYSYNNIGSLYMTIGNEDLALEYYEKSKVIREDIDDKQGIANSYDNIGGIYKSQGKYDLALQHYRHALSLQNQIGFKLGSSASLENIGSIYYLQNRLDSALYFFRNALSISQSINNKEGIANGYYRIASVYFQQKKLDQALENAEKSHSMFEELRNPRNLTQSAELLSKIYEQTGQQDKAFDMYRMFVAMRDSLNNEETQKAAIRQQIQYEYDQKQREDELEQEKQRIIMKARETRKNVIMYSVIAIAILSIIFLIYVYNRYRIIRTQNTIIEKQSEKINDSINYAKKIQNATIPSPALFQEHFRDSFVYFRPKDVVSGDFYWLHHFGQKTYFSVVDCTGHGVPGAFMSLISNNLLDKVVTQFSEYTPDAMLHHLHHELTDLLTRNEQYEINDGMDLMLCCLDHTQKTLQFSGARHQLLHARNGKITTHQGDRVNIGGARLLSKQVKQKETSFNLHTISLEENDALYLFSDGYIDQIGGAKGKKFYLTNFISLLENMQQRPMEEQCNVLHQTFQEWTSDGNIEQLDDICVIGIKV